MRIDQELSAWMESNISPRKKDRQRNSDVVMAYYGFGHLRNPTLEEVGVAFSIGTRERVRQIINLSFKELVNSDQLPVMARIVEHLEKTSISRAELIRAELANQGLANPDVSLRGIINLAEDIFGLNAYGLFTSELEKLKRDDDEFSSDTYLITHQLRDELKPDLKKVRTLPGQLGLAKLAYLDEVIKKSGHMATILELIRTSNNALIIPDVEGEWYVYDDRDNTLINACEKIFTITEVVDLTTLAINLQNSLRRRSNKFEYPPVRVVEEWIKKSKLFDIHDNVVHFLGKRSELTPIENDAVKYLSDGRSVDLPVFREYLMSLGYEKPHSDKFITTSPIISIDKETGHKKSLYSLINNSILRNSGNKTSNDRYEAYKQRLKALLSVGTDADIEAVARREQSILRDWLFEGKDSEKCAICGEMFNVKALVTAHKKKRAICTEDERTDPNIVFPLCKFGCDYLYEEGILTVTGGKVVCAGNHDVTTADLQRAKQLEGRLVQNY